MKNKKGISLIVLIITIIVVIILAAVVVLTLSKNNPIESAKEARFKEDIRTFQDELALYISKQYANAGGQWDGSISAKSFDDMIKYIPSFSKKYEGKFIINQNNLEYTSKLNDNEKDYAHSLNVKERLLPIEYQQVEYIESTGTQWINTKTNNIFKIDTIAERISGSNLITSESSGGSAICIRANWYNNNYYFRGSWNSSNLLELETITLDTKEKRVISLDLINKQLIWGEQKFELKQIGENLSKTNTIPAYIFARNYGGNADGCASWKVYGYLKLFDSNGKILKFFIPCYSTTTVTDVDGVQVPANTKGMYDTVEGKFYTNQGTGDFIAGPEV